MPKSKLANAIANFNENYNTKITTDSFLASTDRFKQLDNFLSENANNHRSAQEYYLLNLAYFYVQAVNDTCKLKENGSFEIPEFGVIEFIEDFDKLMEAQHEYVNRDKENLPKREKFEGIKEKDLMACVAKAAKQNDVMLSYTWAKQFGEGKISMDALKLLAERSENTLNTVAHMGANGIQQMVAAEGKNDVRDALDKFITVRETVKFINQKRGFFWKFFHPIQNYREKQYLASLEEKSRTFTNKGFPVEKRKGDLQKIGVLDNHVEQIKNYKDYSAIRENKRLFEEQIKQPNANKDSVMATSKYNEKFKVADSKEKLVNEMMSAITGSSFSANVLGNFKGQIFDAMEKHILDSCRSSEMYGDGKQIVDSLANNLFREAFKQAGNLNITQPKDRVITAQKMTDAVLKGMEGVFDNDSIRENLQNPILKADRLTVERLLQDNYADLSENSINNVVDSATSEYEKEPLIVEEVKHQNEMSVSERVGESVAPQNNLDIGSK